MSCLQLLQGALLQHCSAVSKHGMIILANLVCIFNIQKTARKEGKKIEREEGRIDSNIPCQFPPRKFNGEANRKSKVTHNPTAFLSTPAHFGCVFNKISLKRGPNVLWIV